jgi:hypothetical protein
MNVILGPCPCHTCRSLLVWDGQSWRNYVDGYAHVCPHPSLRAAVDAFVRADDSDAMAALIARLPGIEEVPFVSRAIDLLVEAA